MERASVLQDLIVKALADPSKHTSAYTMRQTFRRWIPTMRSGNPWTPPKGPLQECLVAPIVEACIDAVVIIESDAHLRTAPMGAIDLYFVDPDSHPDYPVPLRPENFTDRHFSLIESEFGITGFPTSNIAEWRPHLGGTPGLVIQFVCGDVLDIHEQSPDAFARLLIEEISDYLGFDPRRDLLACVAIPSSDEQLNDAGTWDKRPPPISRRSTISSWRATS